MTGLPARVPWLALIVALAGGAAALPAAAPAVAAPRQGAAAVVAPPALRLVVAPPARGRVLVLRSHRLDVVLDGRVVRSVAVRQPVDALDLPALVGDDAYVATLFEDAGVAVRVGAVLVQRPGTTLTASGVRLVLADSGGAGPARVTGAGARLDLRRSVVAPAAPAALRGTAARPPAAPGLRFSAGSTVLLEDVALDGLGSSGTGSRSTGASAALRVDGGSLVLRRVDVRGGGPGVEVRDADALLVDGLDGDRVGGTVLDVGGGAGARLTAISSSGSAGAAVRLGGTRDTTLTGLTSTGDLLALSAADVAGLRARGVRSRGAGLVLGGTDVDLDDPDVEAPADALRATRGGQVTVRGGSLAGRAAAVRAEGGVVLRSVAVHGDLLGAVHPGPDAGRRGAPAAWWDRPVRGTGVATVLVLFAAAVLEVLRARRGPAAGPGAPVPAVRAPARSEGEPAGELVLDLGEAWRS